nr:putative transcriptional regulatory protein c11d3.07c [Quercus suber]
MAEPGTLAPYAVSRRRMPRIIVNTVENVMLKTTLNDSAIDVRLISCSKTSSGCARCTHDGAVCAYSRTGVIRRNKRKHDKISQGATRGPVAHTPDQALSASPNGDTESSASKPDAGLQSQMATDIETTRERLSGSQAMQTSSLSALSSLSEAYAAVWHDGTDFSKAGNHYFTFEDRSHIWVDAFVQTLARGRPLTQPAPIAVLEHLRASRPDLVSDRAWLVMYYSIILSFVSSNHPTDTSTKDKLRCNLWLAMNDVRLLLEPSEANVQALALLASHVEEFTTPALSGMLVANACRMLQALGVNYRRLGPETREQRRMLFWYLNVMDKGLALIFGRPPSFHQAMAKDIPMPTLKELCSFQPHNNARDAPSLFGSHFLLQTMQLSDIIGEIWNCLHEQGACDDQKIADTSERLDSWFEETSEILDAAAIAEKPFLDAKACASIDLGIVHRRFQYYWLSLLVKQSSPRWKSQCTKLSKTMLSLLEQLISDSEEPYNGIVWHLVCSPFTPFFNLFGEILSNGQGGSKGNKEAFAAMELLPVFLEKMSVRNSLAAKLKSIATVFVQHARSVIYRQKVDAENQYAAPDSDLVLPDPWPSNANVLDWDSFFNYTMTAPALDSAQMRSSEAEIEDLTAWTNNFMEGAVVDWMGWNGQQNL